LMHSRTTEQWIMYTIGETKSKDESTAERKKYRG
jgi:hypothetical protein